MNHYYDPGPDRARKVDQLFSSIAGKYDLINDLQSFGLHRLWKKKVVRLTGIAPEDQVLDLCCGTGDIAEAFGRKVAVSIGVDFNRSMLSVARQRAGRNPGISTSYVCGDALNLPFEDRSFDVVTVGYGLRNLADIDCGLSEIFRVLKLNGKILILEFGKPENPALRRIYFGYLKVFVPAFGKLFFRKADFYGYILESLNSYPGPLAIDRKLKKLGCQTTHVHHILGGTMSINVAICKK